jgi:hypothetical protein
VKTHSSRDLREQRLGYQAKTSQGTSTGICVLKSEGGKSIEKKLWQAQFIAQLTELDQVSLSILTLQNYYQFVVCFDYFQKLKFLYFWILGSQWIRTRSGWRSSESESTVEESPPDREEVKELLASHVTKQWHKQCLVQAQGIKGAPRTSKNVENISNNNF